MGLGACGRVSSYHHVFVHPFRARRALPAHFVDYCIRSWTPDNDTTPDVALAKAVFANIATCRANPTSLPNEDQLPGERLVADSGRHEVSPGGKRDSPGTPTVPDKEMPSSRERSPVLAPNSLA